MRTHHRLEPRAFSWRSLALAGVLALGMASTPHAGDGDDGRAWFAAFESAYESGDTPAYGALLTADYRFLSPDPSLLRRFPAGFDREDELVSHARLFRGATGEDGMPLPRALTVDVAFADVAVCPDPEFPGDPGHVLIHVGRASVAIRFADGTSMRDVAPHAFWLVRTGEGTGGGSGWMCRRWVERPAAELLAAAPSLPPARGLHLVGARGGTRGQRSRIAVRG